MVSMLHQEIRASESVVYAELDGEAVLLNVETGIYFGLDQIGTEIWKMLEQGASEVTIFERLLEEYDVEPAQLRADVADFLSVLESKGLTKVADR